MTRFLEIRAVTEFEEADLDRDFMAIYHVDMYSLPTPRFFDLAAGIHQYEQGVIHRKLVQENESRQKLLGARPGESVIEDNSDDDSFMRNIASSLQGTS